MGPQSYQHNKTSTFLNVNVTELQTQSAPYSSALSLTSALDGEMGPRPFYHRERDPVFNVQQAGLASGPVRTEEKISPPPGFDARTTQPVASRYTNYVIPARNNVYMLKLTFCLWRNSPTLA